MAGEMVLTLLVVSCLVGVVHADPSHGCITLFPGMTLYGHNDVVHAEISLEACIVFCQESPFCKSFDYVADSVLGDAMCFMSSETHETQAYDFDEHYGGLYGVLGPCGC